MKIEKGKREIAGRGMDWQMVGTCLRHIGNMFDCQCISNVGAADMPKACPYHLTTILQHPPYHLARQSSENGKRTTENKKIRIRLQRTRFLNILSGNSPAETDFAFPTICPVNYPYFLSVYVPSSSRTRVAFVIYLVSSEYGIFSPLNSH